MSIPSSASKKGSAEPPNWNFITDRQVQTLAHVQLPPCLNLILHISVFYMESNMFDKSYNVSNLTPHWQLNIYFMRHKL